MYNLSFDESQRRIVQAQRNHFVDDHTSLAHTEERVIILDVRRHPASMAKASKAYAKATSSIIKFLIAENDQMVKD